MEAPPPPPPPHKTCDSLREKAMLALLTGVLGAEVTWILALREDDRCRSDAHTRRCVAARL
jgi:hypothetical protein